MPRAEAQAALAADDPDAVIHALLRTAYHDPDARWVQEQCLRFVRDPDWQVRHMAALGLSHLARLHGARARAGAGRYFAARQAGSIGRPVGPGRAGAARGTGRLPASQDGRPRSCVQPGRAASARRGRR
jgi:hypothetical protein